MATALSSSNTPTLQPNFAGMIRGEFLKITRQRAIWVTGAIIAALGVLLGLIFIPLINSMYSSRIGGRGTTQPVTVTPIHPDPGGVIYSLMQDNFSIIVRPLSGLFIIIAAVIVIALEYQQGTIRVILSRGVGRVQLLGAKVVALLALGLIDVTALIAIGSIMVLVALGLTGHSDVLSHLPGFFWSDVGTNLIVMVINIVATAGLAITFAVIGRSLAFGLGFSAPFFFVENILTGILTLVTSATSDQKWVGAAKFFLGTNLSQLAGLLTPTRTFADTVTTTTGSSSSGGGLTSGQSLLVILAYAAVFVAVSWSLTARRDVMQ